MLAVGGSGTFILGGARRVCVAGGVLPAFLKYMNAANVEIERRSHCCLRGVVGHDCCTALYLRSQLTCSRRGRSNRSRGLPEVKALRSRK